MIYLKTYFHSENEINFINLNLEESYSFIDKFIICEYDINHNGVKRDFIYEKVKDKINPELRDKIIYLKCEIRHLAVDAVENESLAHKNETLMRGYFVKCINFDDDDIIISVDADEIIYGSSYPDIIEGVKNHSCVKIELNQFFYRLDYLWTDNRFIAPTAAFYKQFKKRYPNNWRYEGRLLKGAKGCHFSWCMTVSDMVQKLKKYAHVKYKHLADSKILEQAIHDKEYPFDTKKPFTIKVIDRNDPVMPKSISRTGYDEFYKKYSK